MVDDGSTDGTAEVLGRFAGRITVAELERTWCFGRPQSRHGARAGRAARVSRRGRPAASALPGAFRRRGRRRSRGGRLPLRLARSRLRRRTCPLRARPAVRPGRGPVPRARRCGFAAHLRARRTSRSCATPGPFDEDESLQADWDYWLRLAASGATFRGVPGKRGDHPTPQREHVGLGGNTAGGRRDSPSSSGISRVTNGARPASTRTRVCEVGDRLCSARRPRTSRVGFASRAARAGWSARRSRSPVGRVSPRRHGRELRERGVVDRRG